MKYVARRTAALPVQLLIVSLIVFFLIQVKREVFDPRVLHDDYNYVLIVLNGQLWNFLNGLMYHQLFSWNGQIYPVMLLLFLMMTCDDDDDEVLF